jgi:ELWxxDGT repeat protein
VSSRFKQNIFEARPSVFISVVVSFFLSACGSDTRVIESGTGSPADPRYLYYGNDGVHGDELWVTDGTAAGTRMVLDINPGTASSAGVTCFSRIGSVAYLIASDGVHGYELWKSDGTAAGTVMLKDIRPGSATSLPSCPLQVGNSIYFSVYDDTHGSEIWKTDGTPAGTQLIKDINPGAASSVPSELISANGLLVFIADDGVHGGNLGQ